MSDEQAEHLRNEGLKKDASSAVRMKVSEKGAVSVYGMGRFPVTLYKEQWLKLLDMAAEILRVHYCERDSIEDQGLELRKSTQTGRIIFQPTRWVSMRRIPLQRSFAQNHQTIDGDALSHSIVARRNHIAPTVVSAVTGNVDRSALRRKRLPAAPSQNRCLR